MQSESRMLEIGTSGLMSGDGKRGGAFARQYPRLSSTLLRHHRTSPHSTIGW